MEKGVRRRCSGGLGTPFEAKCIQNHCNTTDFAKVVRLACTKRHKSALRLHSWILCKPLLVCGHRSRRCDDGYLKTSELEPFDTENKDKEICHRFGPPQECFAVHSIRTQVKILRSQSSQCQDPPHGDQSGTDEHVIAWTKDLCPQPGP